MTCEPTIFRTRGLVVRGKIAQIEFAERKGMSLNETAEKAESDRTGQRTL